MRLRQPSLRSTAPFGLLALIGALGLSGGAGAHPARARTTAATVAGSHLQITQVEYRLMLSRGVVKAGPVSLQAIDRGSDPHDLRLLALSSRRQEVTAPRLTPGQRWSDVVYLEPGHYHLWCSLPEHAKRGMRATLTVVR